MKWPWQRRRRSADDSEEAEVARHQAERKLRDACRRHRDIEEVTEQLRELRERNRFAAMIEETMRVQPHPRPDERR